NVELTTLLDVVGGVVHEPDHLHHEGTLHRAATLDLGRDQREEALEPLRRRATFATCLLQDREQGVQEALGDLAQEMVFGREVIEEGLLRDVGGMADLIHLDRLDAVRREPLDRGGEDAIMHLAYPTLTSRSGSRGRS